MQQMLAVEAVAVVVEVEVMVVVDPELRRTPPGWGEAGP